MVCQLPLKFCLENNLHHIIKGCKAGKRSAQKDLYNYFADEMFTICLYYSKDYQDAEDTLHESFIKVFDHIKQLKSTQAAGGWIRRIMINTALAKYRRNKIMYVVDDNVDFKDEVHTDDVLDKISADELMEMIMDLSPRYKLVFNLYAIEGYAHKEIAEKLNISIGTSKSNLARARYILQEKVLKIFEERNIRKVK